ncbi:MULTISPECIES: polymer-forming cytoskeletal protein [unclassified Fibrobacter]|jgi:cytoskeletal protein CcmA (bactofilin family)|uniref:bactofilin family protein n=2 Tax=Fibrobacter TaxID=832 RepID=UPI00091E98C1|nr:MULTISPECIES: polymer-forming cytoskeletal protein [unclassified Fibrobacter]SHN01558.1 protein CcmA, bactofilin family [Fibrobacter sp. UWB7]SMG35693.1 protein CcmA, bactofilin family [Fibrobacter sp. UWB13]
MGSKNEQEFTQVGRNVQVNGDIIGKTDIRIAGKVKGKVLVEGELILEKLASIEGDVKCNAAILAGNIKGNVDCKSKLILEDNAKIIGNVKAEQLVINEGAILQGNCDMNETPASKKEK